MVPSEDQEFVFRESHSHQSSWRRYRFDGRTVRRTGERKQRGWLESWGNVAKVVRSRSVNVKIYDIL